jgi:hypothetical protein
MPGAAGFDLERNVATAFAAEIVGDAVTSAPEPRSGTAQAGFMASPAGGPDVARRSKRSAHFGEQKK